MRISDGFAIGLSAAVAEIGLLNPSPNSQAMANLTRASFAH